jgi:hypothetical protein
MSEEVRAEVIAPFGPRMLKTQLPRDLIARMNKHCDSLINKKSFDASDQLVGHVEQEIRCEIEKVDKLGEILFEATNGLYTNFMRQSSQNFQPPNQVEIHNAWFVRSFATDYNPVHIHTSGQFSCVLYLKVPLSIGKKNWKHSKEKYASEGWTDFLFGSTNLCSVGSFRVQPEVGDLYVFPAYLSHCAYPFFGEGERRSFSANLTLKTVESNKS